MSKIYDGYKYILNMNTGVVHDLSNTQDGCKLDEIKDEHMYPFNSWFWDDKEGHGYKERCDHCMEPDG